MMEAWQKLKRFVGIYQHVRHYIEEAAHIEQAVGYLPPSNLDRLIVQYGGEALHRLHLNLTVRGGSPMAQPGLLVGNHISYLDIPVLMSQLPARFVAKHEVRRFPIVGRAAERAGTVFVKRQKEHSRRDVGYTVANGILHDHKRVVIFPAGTTTTDEHVRWRWGPFRVAQEHDLWLQPFRLRYRPIGTAAYIGRDFFPLHLWRLLGHQSMQVEIEFAEPQKIVDFESETLKWWKWTREFVAAANQPVAVPECEQLAVVDT